MYLNQSLPVSEFLESISEQLQNQQRLVLCAEPGAGKSTAVPFYLMHQTWLQDKKIVMLEPRRLAARSIAVYLASELGESVGEQVGYRIKNDTKVSAKTCLEIVTEGVLTRMIQTDPELAGIGLVIFDEFHERNLQSDLGLMLLKEVMASLREDLACLVMSATIDAGMVSGYIANENSVEAPVIACPGRIYPVDIMFRPSSGQSSSNWALAQQVFNACKAFIQSAPIAGKDILVFLPGQGAILTCLRYFQEQLPLLHTGKVDTQLLPLYGALTMVQQTLALVPDKQGRQKVIFTTNIAETSLTIAGVSVVIDSGLEKQSHYDVKTGMSRLTTAFISKASAKQRAGRAGRLAAGHCVRLWSEAKHQQLADFQPAQISTTDLSDLVLQLAIWGNTDVQQQDWLTKPPNAHYDKALNLLCSFGFLDAEQRITDKGKRAAELPINARMSAVLLSSIAQSRKGLAALLVAILGEQDILKQFHTVDFSRRIAAVLEPSEYRGQINQNALRQIKQNWQKLSQAKHLQTIQDAGDSGALLLQGYGDLLAKKRQHSETQYLLANGRGVELSDDDPLRGVEWIVVLAMDAQSQSGRIWLAMALEEQAVFNYTTPRLAVEESLFWDDRAGVAKRKTVEKFGALLLSEHIHTQLSQEQQQRFLMQQIQEKGVQCLNWTPACQRWLERASWLSSNNDLFPSISARHLLATVDTWLLPYLGSIVSLPQLQKLPVPDLLHAVIDWEYQSMLNDQAPDRFTLPDGKNVVIRYDSAQGPIVSVQLQALFGLTESPMLAGGKVPLRFEMLSPARRPIQTTSDLNGFWRTSYFDVAKDMRGRYPKHRWPDEPLKEKPGRSIKSARQKPR